MAVEVGAAGRLAAAGDGWYGRPVVRCFVQGAAPAVMARAATAWSGGASIPWDTDLAGRARAQMERMVGKLIARRRSAAQSGNPSVTKK